MRNAPAQTNAPAPPHFPSREQLFEDQRRLLPDARLILDVGAHHGQSSLLYLDKFPAARVFAFEPESANFAVCSSALAHVCDQVRVIRQAVTDHDDRVTLHINTHDGTHSLFEIGEQRFWAGYAAKRGEAEVPAVTIDSFLEQEGISAVDILKMDIQGAELAALNGARKALQEARIGLVACEVEFKELYRGQPLFWDVGARLALDGYNLFGLYDCFYHPRNPNVLAWADAIFIGPRLQNVPEWSSAA
ncbi:MAG: FkbM family methyltransferase [Acetobacteraceae bacterium]